MVTCSTLCSSSPSADEGESSPMMEMLGSAVKGTLVKYWILFCCSMFFVVSFSGKVMVYKILYIVLFLFCVVLYQVGLIYVTPR